MKLNRYIFMGFATVALLASCVSEDLKTAQEKADKGRMTLDVSMLQPQATRANSEYTDAQLASMTKVTNYPVTITDSEGNTVKEYATASAFPEGGEVLAVGEYTVSAHTPGDIQKKMTAPYYAGSEPMTIMKNLATEVDVVCKMLNSKIEVAYTEDFLNLFDDWSITLDDGSVANGTAETALSFTSANGDEPAAVYWYFEENVEALTVNFRATLKSDGSVVTDRVVLDKAQAAQHYDNDNHNFTGGDALVLNFNPTEATTGTVTGITLTATVSFDDNETSEVITLDLTDKSLQPEEPQDPQDPQNPQPGDDDKIALTIPAPVTLSADESATADPASGDVVMAAVNGLKSVMVKVNSSSDEMMEQLAKVANEYPGVDLVNGCEVVGNQNLVAFLGSLGKEITVPTEGDTEYTFPVGQFYLFLGILPGEHNFVMTVTDMAGNKKSGTVKVTITE